MNGKKMRDAREKKGLTTVQLGELIGVSQAMITRIETGTKEPSIVLLKAIAAALDHAKLTEAETENLRIRMDRDDRRDHWEVQWRSGDLEYNYDIDPDTGAVLDWDRDFEPQRKSAPAAQTPSPTHPTQPAAPAAQLSEDEALAIALDHAGFTAGEVTNLHIRLDTDDRTPDYEIEFRQGRLEYEYEIHAETGAVKDFDRDD